MKQNRMPFDEGTDRELFDNSFHTASMSECTGLIPVNPNDEFEVSSYSDIYDIPLSDKKSVRRDIMNNDQNRNENRNDSKNQNQNQNQNKNKFSNKIDDKRNDSTNRKDR